tara:strand:- start:17572 stop:18003 length:432 start_codon:yes stop_codon:yes gene_type:complete
MAISLVPVIEGLYSHLTGDSTFNSAIGGSASSAGKLYYGLAPKDTSFPFVAYTVTRNRDEMPVLSEASYAVTVQFVIVESREAGPRACMDINDKLRLRLDRQTFAITGLTMLAAALEVERGPVDDDEAYVQTVDYLIRGFAAS